VLCKLHKIVTYLRILAIRWLKPWEIWWNLPIPDVVPENYQLKDKDGKYKKDFEYYGILSSIPMNKPFLNEITEREAKIKKAIEVLEMEEEPNYQRIRDLRNQLKGIKRIIGIIWEAGMIVKHHNLDIVKELKPENIGGKNALS